jgi:hypothetical protein
VHEAGRLGDMLADGNAAADDLLARLQDLESVVAIEG